jgi:hypothetical protein
MKNAISELLHPSLKAMSRLVAGRNFDVLDNHSKFFKQPEKEFAPRINKRKAESTLKKTGIYNAPRPHSQSKASARSAKDEQTNSMSAFEDNYEAMESSKTTARTNTVLTDRSNKSIILEQNNQKLKQPSIHTPTFNDDRKKELYLKRTSEKYRVLLGFYSLLKVF